MSENIWFTSDTHFHHSRILEFCRDTRDGENEVEMTHLMIERWNKEIKSGDRVYHLGDFCFRGRKHVQEVAEQLNGQIHLILGNHDHIIRKSRDITQHFASIDKMKHVKIGEYRFILCHFPLAEWWDCHKGVIHLHGHLHGNNTNTVWQQQFKSMDVGIDARNDSKMIPFHIDEVLRYVADKDIMSHH